MNDATGRQDAFEEKLRRYAPVAQTPAHIDAAIRQAARGARAVSARRTSAYILATMTALAAGVLAVVLWGIYGKGEEPTRFNPPRMTADEEPHDEPGERMVLLTDDTIYWSGNGGKEWKEAAKTYFLLNAVHSAQTETAMYHLTYVNGKPELLCISFKDGRCVRRELPKGLLVDFDEQSRQKEKIMWVNAPRIEFVPADAPQAILLTGYMQEGGANGLPSQQPGAASVAEELNFVSTDGGKSWALHARDDDEVRAELYKQYGVEYTDSRWNGFMEAEWKSGMAPEFDFCSCRYDSRVRDGRLECWGISGFAIFHREGALAEVDETNPGFEKAGEVDIPAHENPPQWLNNVQHLPPTNFLGFQVAGKGGKTALLSLWSTGQMEVGGGLLVDLLRSFDKGQTWERIPLPPSIARIDCGGNDDDTVQQQFAMPSLPYLPLYVQGWSNWTIHNNKLR